MHTPGQNKHLKNLPEHNKRTNRKNEIAAADPDRSFEEQIFLRYQEHLSVINFSTNSTPK